MLQVFYILNFNNVILLPGSFHVLVLIIEKTFTLLTANKSSNAAINQDIKPSDYDFHCSQFSQLIF
jgi:hypothetical protein